MLIVVAALLGFQRGWQAAPRTLRRGADILAQVPSTRGQASAAPSPEEGESPLLEWGDPELSKQHGVRGRGWRRRTVGA